MNSHEHEGPEHLARAEISTGSLGGPAQVTTTKRLSLPPLPP